MLTGDVDCVYHRWPLHCQTAALDCLQTRDSCGYTGSFVAAHYFRMLQEYTMLSIAQPSCQGERYLSDFNNLSHFVLDEADTAQARTIAVPTLVTKTLMQSLEDRVQLARAVLAFAAKLNDYECGHE